ncbi:NAD-dependent epimerase/dehydratase family protein [Xylophilus sp.]|uniref:NAD-dependent epimerase/dehydratase family protein n=1 Tax=Xylophilus sp. TaxID=2653893 RepID=UPI0013B973EE|nr:NAD(P)-dependent oxidoreductase [Xylophilus sp.]KAF1045997.1 MAG: Protein YeeZ [Xylophilus sp.]
MSAARPPEGARAAVRSTKDSPVGAERQRLLVLGAGGFIGRHVVAALQASDWARPVAASRSGRLAPGTPPVEVLRLDARDPDALRRAAAQAAGVVDCTAAGPAGIVAGAQALQAAWQHEAAPPRLVYLSSMAVYGDAEGRVDETAARVAAEPASYGGAKAAAEALLARRAGETVVLRPGCVYGADSPQWSLRIARLLRSRRIGDLGAGGDGLCNAVHADDLAQAVLAALRVPEAAGQAFNLSLPDPPTWNGYFLAFARALGAVPLARIGARRMAFETQVAALPLRLAERAAQLLRLPADRLPPAIPPSLARLWRQEIRLDVSRAGQVLGLRWTPLAQGLRETAEGMAGGPP